MKINELERQIIEASQSYYSGQPTISDDEFDSLIEKLRDISPGNPLLKTTSTGYTPNLDQTGQKSKHKYRHVGSLEKINIETCNKYFEKHPEQYIITSKIDGGSIVCYYGLDGRLEKAVTRGDGETGIDCTQKLKYAIPQKIDTPNTAIRGEITISKKIFETFYFNAANPRNAALGIISRDNPTQEDLSRLSFIAYNAYGDNKLPTKKSEIMEWLSKNAFTTAEYTQLHNKIPENLEAIKGNLDAKYLADGLVLTNENNRFEEVAYKFIAETAETTVTKVEWETSRLGNIIPVVHFNPVKLSGATLAKCSGFNAKWILDNNIGQGAKIVIHRSGEVIPYIKQTLVGAKFLSIPNRCPDCDSQLEWKGVNIYCPGKYCLKKKLSNIILWIETLAEVDSLGENILIPFIKYMKWEKPSDIYDTTENDWFSVIDQYFDTKHSNELLEELYNKLYKEPVDSSKFFSAFGFPSVGINTSKRIAEKIGLERYFEYGPDLAYNLGRITKPALESLYEHFSEMKEVYIKIKNRHGFISATLQESQIKVVITGTLSKSRKELMIEFGSHGIELADAISREVSCLITNDPNSGSSKNLAAKKLGINILTEEQFRTNYLKGEME